MFKGGFTGVAPQLTAWTCCSALEWKTPWGLVLCHQVLSKIFQRKSSAQVWVWAVKEGLQSVGLEPGFGYNGASVGKQGKSVVLSGLCPSELCLRVSWGISMCHCRDGSRAAPVHVCWSWSHPKRPLGVPLPQESNLYWLHVPKCWMSKSHIEIWEILSGKGVTCVKCQLFLLHIFNKLL